MLEFDKPLPARKDVHISDGGELVLRNPLTSPEAMTAYGRLALFQVLGAFDQVSPSYTFQTRINRIQRHVYGLAREIMKDPRTAGDTGPFYSMGPAHRKQHAHISDFGEGLGMARHGRGDVDEDYTGLVIMEVGHTRGLIKPEVVAV